MSDTRKNRDRWRRTKRAKLKRRPFELVDQDGQRVARRPEACESNMSETVVRPLPPEWYSVENSGGKG